MDLWIAQGSVLPSTCDQEGPWLRKTSALITAALLAGAQVGRATIGQMHIFERFGRELGEAYQLADDALDEVEDAGRNTLHACVELAHDRLRNALQILEEGFPRSAAFRTMAALAEFCVHRAA